MALSLIPQSFGLTKTDMSTDLHDIRFVAEQKIDDFKNNGLPTENAAILEAFIKFLDDDGVRNMCEDIAKFQTVEQATDHVKNLIGRILIPSM